MNGLPVIPHASAHNPTVSLNSTLFATESEVALQLRNNDIAFVKSYSREIEESIKRISRNFPVESIGDVRFGQYSYPLYRIQNFTKPTPSKIPVLISGGVHGDEPAGVFAILRYFEHLLQEPTSNRFDIVAYPCINPSGFEANTIDNLYKQNLNREWKRSTQEIDLVKADLRKLNLQFRFTLDMHEAAPYWAAEGFQSDANPRGCYLYETPRNPSQAIGRHLIDSLPPEYEVCQWPLIYNEANDRGVVTTFPETTTNAVYAQGPTFDAYLLKHFTQHAFVSETPTGWPVEKRVRVQLHFLERALASVAQEKP